MFSEFGIKVKKLRIDNGLSMKDLAEILGVTKSRINMWENSNSIPKDNILISLSNLFNVSIDFLLGNNEMGKKVPESEVLYYLQKNLEKLDEKRLIKAKSVLQIIFDDIFTGDD